MFGSKNKKHQSNPPHVEYFLSESQRKKVGRRSLRFGSLQLFVVIFVLMSVAVGSSLSILENDGESSAQTSSYKSLQYLNDGENANLAGTKTPLTKDIRGNGTIEKNSGGGIKYTTTPDGERSEQYIGAHNKPLWPDNSEGWFAFDFAVHDNDSSWRVIEQEHEGDASPSRALEAGRGTIKLVSRFGAPHTNGPNNTWLVKTLVPHERIQIVGFEKFGQGNAKMQAWWRRAGESTWVKFADTSNFSMGYTSGYPGRYHKRGTYHGNHAEQSSVTWYGTAVMYSSRSAAENAAGISTSSPPPPAPIPSPSPTPVPPPTPLPPPSPSPSPSPTPSPPPPVTIPDASPTDPVAIPDEVVKEDDGSIIADFTGDGLNEKVKDTNDDGYIDPKTEIVESMPIRSEVPKASSTVPSTIDNNEFTNNPVTAQKSSSNKLTFAAVTVGGILTLGALAYISIMKLSIFAGLRSNLGL